MKISEGNQNKGGCLKMGNCPTKPNTAGDKKNPDLNLKFNGMAIRSRLANLKKFLENGR